MADAHQSDPARRRRLRWRARRGLLENDLVLTRFLDGHESTLSDREVAGLDRLLELPDNELLDLVLRRTEPGLDMDDDARRVLRMLREA
jgi:antitoxin CptB